MFVLIVPSVFTASMSFVVADASAQLLRNWCEQRSSNRDDLDRVTGEVRTVYCTGVDLLLI
jgi:hypothetical protein